MDQACFSLDVKFKYYKLYLRSHFSFKNKIVDFCKNFPWKHKIMKRKLTSSFCSNDSTYTP